MIGLLKDAARDWIEDDCPRMAAAMAYYTVFSLPPLLVIILMLTGLVVDPDQISSTIQSEMAAFVGQDGAEQIQAMIRNANRPGSGGPLVVVLGVLGVLFGATGAFAQLQTALNRAWEVQRDPDESGILGMAVKRLLSLGMVLVVALLLLLMAVLSSLVSSLGGTAVGVLPAWMSGGVTRGLDVGGSLVMATLLFTFVFQVLPDAKVAWKDVWVGALVTAVLFVLGKFLLGLYLSFRDPGQAYGAAGSLALIMFWIYYSSMILLFGAEFTQRWATRTGSGVEPDDSAVRVVEATEGRGGG